jgi:hypothetical protein
MTIDLTCGGCGKRLKVRPEWAGKKARCPTCGAVSVVPAAGPAPGTAVRPAGPARPGPTPPPGDVLTVEPLDPVGIIPLQPEPDAAAEAPPVPVAPAAPAEDTCPECGAFLARDAVICLDCGFNRKTGKQLKTVSRRIERHWYLGGFSDPAAWLVFVLLYMFLGLAGYLSEDLLVGAVLLAVGVLPGVLLLGTFTRVRITRDREGRPLLFRDRWVFFIPVAHATIDLDEYQVIRLGHQEGGTEVHAVAALLLLILCGLIPGLVFWALLFRGSTFTLEIAPEHDDSRAADVEPEVIYRGRSETKMRALGDALKEIAGLRYG